MFKSFSRNNPSSAGNVIDIGGNKGEAVAPVWQPTVADSELIERLELKSQLHEVLLERLNLAVIDKVQPEELRREVAALVSNVLSQQKRPMRSEDFNQLIDELLDEVLGFGPLEPLLADPTINDILVNSH
ncbi:MAG: CpaF family protein, partial [Rhodobacteraceae bacterium]|nr:CpaF family protein [Paracoccaceae bacterium]